MRYCFIWIIPLFYSVCHASFLWEVWLDHIHSWGAVFSIRLSLFLYCFPFLLLSITSFILFLLSHVHGSIYISLTQFLVYALIIGIHIVFIAITHLLGYRILEGIFLVLCVFFLFYFSPLFFLDDEWESPDKKAISSWKDIFKDISPKTSLLLPIVLLYVAIYGFLFSTFSGQNSGIILHGFIVLGIYTIWIVYMIAFHWKNDIFFELFHFHTLFAMISTIIFAFSIPFYPLAYHILSPIIGIMAIMATCFLLFYTKRESIPFLFIFLLAIFATLYLSITYFIWDIAMVYILVCWVILAFSIFEIFPKISIFTEYITLFQYFSLLSILIFLPAIVFIAASTLHSISLILLWCIALFFLSIHVRYTNYVVFIVSILSTYFFYALLFADLLMRPSMSSLFLFLFFLPILLIGTTYFWQEVHPYDFIILHYSSIAFSALCSLYSIFFLWWWGDILFVASLCIFWVALLFFMSYFRFRTQKYLSTYL